MKLVWHGAKAKADAKAGALRALEKGANSVLDESQRLVPVSPWARGGYLKSTGKADVDEGALRAAVSYDSPGGDHLAIYAHERMDVSHETGQAKFLEQALNSNRDEILADMARAIKRELGA